MSTSQGDHHAKIAMWATYWFCFLLCGLMLLAAECMYGNDKKTSSYKAAKNVKASAAELSSRNQSLLALYSAEIETAADKIISGSPSPDARRQALVWKAEAIPVMQTSLLNTDPIAAVLDTWAFIFQMTTFMERPELKQTMGDYYPVVTETLTNMQTEVERLVKAVAPKANVADLRQRVRGWAEAHPIQNSLASRQSADPDVIKKVGQTNLGTFGSIKELAESMGDLSARLDAYNLYLPKEARWQAELLVGDLMRDPTIKAAAASMDSLANTGAKLDTERLSIQDFVHQERLQTLDALQQQRIATIAAVHAERLGATADLHNVRLSATADLRKEREAVVEALHTQEVELLNGVNAATDRHIQTLGTKGHDLIDHLFLRAIELMLLTLVLFSLVAWILLRRFSSRPPVGDEQFRRAA